MPALSTPGTSGRAGRAAEGPPARGVVLGIGNLLNRDEGVGIHAVRALEADQASGPEAGVELLDGGVLGLDLLPLVEDCSHLLVLDAIDAGRPPGAVVELDGHDLGLYGSLKLSQHQVTFQELLGLALLRDRLPDELRIVGVQPLDLEMGVELSPIVAASLPEVLARARAITATWPDFTPATRHDSPERTANP